MSNKAVEALMWAMCFALVERQEAEDAGALEREVVLDKRQRALMAKINELEGWIS